MKKDFEIMRFSYSVMVTAGTSGDFDMWFGNWKAGFHSQFKLEGWIPLPSSYASLWIVDTCLGVHCDIIMAGF